MRSVRFVLAAAVLAAAFCQGAGDDVASGVPLVFEPEAEWKEIQPGQQIPGGLDVRMDLSSGKKEARLLAQRPGSRVFKTRDSGDGVQAGALVTATSACSGESCMQAGAGAHEIAVVDASGGAHPALAVQAAPAGQPAAAAEDGAATAGADPGRGEGGANDQGDTDTDRLDAASARIADILLGLPEPEPELAAAIQAGRSPAELAPLLQRLWAGRQAQLKEALGSAKTEAQMMHASLGRLLGGVPAATAATTAAGAAAPAAASLPTPLPLEERLELLGELEAYVSTLHNAEDFRGMGGIAAVTQMLNDSSPRVAAAAAWVLGSAVKYAPAVQAQALADGAHVMLVTLLARARGELEAACAAGVASSPEAASAAAATPLALAGKAVYALGALARGNGHATAQLLRLGFVSELRALLEATRRLADSAAAPAPGGASAAAPGAVADAAAEGGVGALASQQRHQQRQQQARQSRGLCVKGVTLLADLAREHREARDAAAAAAAVARDSGLPQLGAGGRVALGIEAGAPAETLPHAIRVVGLDPSTKRAVELSQTPQLPGRAAEEQQRLADELLDGLCRVLHHRDELPQAPETVVGWCLSKAAVAVSEDGAGSTRSRIDEASQQAIAEAADVLLAACA